MPNAAGRAAALSERRLRLPFAVVFCTLAFAEAARRPFRPRLRLRFQKPIASLRMQYSATQHPQATAKHKSSFRRESSAFPTVRRNSRRKPKEDVRASFFNLYLQLIR
jgi:hypothetical protein